MQIGGNFTRENYREFPRLLDYLVEVGITPDKIQTVQFNQVTGRVGNGVIPDYASTCNCTDEPWLWRRPSFSGTRSCGAASPPPSLDRPAAWWNSANDLVVNVDGAIYKCPAFVGREGFSVGDLKERYH